MKTTQEQVDDLTAKVFRLEAIATRLSKAEKQLAGLTRNDSWLADRCKDAADRLAKLESGKAEVQGGGELEKIRNTVGTYARGIGLDRMPTSGVVGYLLHAYYGLKNARGLTVAALGTDYDDAETIAGNVARVRRKLSDAQRERDEARTMLAKSESDATIFSLEAGGARGEVRRLRAALESQREEIGKYNARVAKLEGELRVRTDELGAAQRLIAEAYNIDDDVMVALGDPVKGAEAEELRKGVEDLIKAADSNDGVVSWHALQSLLDRVNARDSNAFLAQREKAPTLPLDREHLGRIVREVWIAWAKEQPNPKPSWLVPWEGLTEPDKEVDRRIGKRLAMEGVVVIEGQLERAETEAKNLREKLAVIEDARIAGLASKPGPDAMRHDLLVAGWISWPGDEWSAGHLTKTLGLGEAYTAMLADRAKHTQAAALRDAGWEERVSGWSPDGGYSAWTLDGAYDAMVAARKATPARLDPDGIAKPLTRIVSHPKVGDCVGPGTPLANPEYEAADGTRTPLAAIATLRDTLGACDHEVVPIDADWGRCTKCGDSTFPISEEAAWGGPKPQSACGTFAADLAADDVEALYTTEAAFECMLADRAKARDTMTQPEPGDIYVDVNGAPWLAIDMCCMSPSEVADAKSLLRPATPEEAAKIRKDNGL